MNGTRYFLDTNAIISLLDGNKDLEKQLQSADWIGTSVICLIEFLSFHTLSLHDRNLLFQLTQRINIEAVETAFTKLETIANFRKEPRLKLPDTIVAAGAINNNAVLLSNDKHFSSLANLSVLNL